MLRTATVVDAVMSAISIGGADLAVIVVRRITTAMELKRRDLDAHPPIGPLPHPAPLPAT